MQRTICHGNNVKVRKIINEAMLGYTVPLMQPLSFFSSTSPRLWRHCGLRIRQGSSSERNTNSLNNWLVELVLVTQPVQT